MKKCFIAILAAAALVCSCIDALQERVDSLEAKVSALEQKLNSNVEAIQQLVNASNKAVTIDSVTETSDGYVIKFSNGTTATISNGKDGNSPVVAVREFEGELYWTVNGEWLLDANGEKVRVRGEDGQDGQDGNNGQDGQDGQDGRTPTFKIEDGKWYVSFDNGEQWTYVGEATTEVSGPQVKVEETATDYVFTVGETVISIPKTNVLSIRLTEELPVVVAAGNSILLNYTITGADNTTHVVTEAKNFEAVLDEEAKTVEVTAPDPFTDGYVIIKAVRNSDGASSAFYINFEEEIASDIVLANGQMWQHKVSEAAYPDQYFTRDNLEPLWGTLEGCEPMLFALSFPGTTSTAYGSRSYTQPYAQLLNSGSSSFNGGVVCLESAAEFKGINGIKINAGLSTYYSYTCSLAVYLQDAEGNRHQLGETVTLQGANASDGTDLYYTPELNEGKIVLEYKDFKSTWDAPYVGEITINPNPAVVLSEKKIDLPVAATSGEISCTAYFADSEPEVSSSEDWLTVSYADGKINYSATANVAAARTAVISVTASAAGRESTTETIEVTQKSALEKEYKLTINLDKVRDALTQVAGGNPSASSYYTFDLTLPAESTDGSGATSDVALKFTNIYGDLTNGYISVFGTFMAASCGSIVNTTPVGKIKRFELKHNGSAGTSSWGMQMSLSVDGASFPAIQATTAQTSSPYVNVIENTENDYKYFKMTQGGGNGNVYYIEVTFVQ